MHEMAAALNIAKTIPFKFLVVHLGVPAAGIPDRTTTIARRRSAASRRFTRWPKRVGVKVALEVMGNSLSTASELVEMLEHSFEGADLGICMDVGHAHLLGDTAEAIEIASEYLVTTHIHDNRRQSDDHLVPVSGQHQLGRRPSWRSRRSATMEC